MHFVRLIIFGGLALSVVFFAASWFFRSTRREALEKEWDADHPDGDEADRDAFVEAGIAEYNAGIVPKLLWLIYILPGLFILYTLITTN
ncbi:MAG: hypothetical protein CR993_06885 [Rhodobacterales bacterium]|nr:MAG: hypothetical protein CR993_06885 [Rhodobacterales bacterium]